MNQSRMFKMPDGRVAYPFPWESGTLPQPWKAGYMRVVIPLTAAERRNSIKKCHIQIVRAAKLKEVKEPRYVLH